MIRACIAIWFFLSLIPSSLAQVRIGAASVKITPPPGTPMAGYYFPRLQDGVHDDLFSKALVIESGGVRIALVSLDIITTSMELVSGARREIERRTGIPGSHVMIGATHAHTGPVIMSGSTRDLALGGASEAARAYNNALPALVAKSVDEANARLASANLFAGIGKEERLSFNRRFLMKDGTVGWNPGKLNPNIVKPAGPIDPDVSVLNFEGVDKKLMASYVNFAMHLDTVGGAKISADYPHVLARHIAEVRGEQCLTLFATGCCGNINHIDVKWHHPQQGNAEAFRIGTILAAEVLRTYSRLPPVTPGPLRVQSEMLRLPLAPINPDKLAHAEDTVRRNGTPGGPKFLEVVDAFKTLDVSDRKGAPIEAEVQVISLGDEIAWVSLPGEIFVELGQAIKRASPFKYTFIAELANGSIGYIPNRTAYSQGNYEVISARCAAGSGEMLVDAAVRMLRAAKRTPAQRGLPPSR